MNLAPNFDECPSVLYPDKCPQSTRRVGPRPLYDTRAFEAREAQAPHHRGSLSSSGASESARYTAFCSAEIPLCAPHSSQKAVDLIHITPRMAPVPISKATPKTSSSVTPRGHQAKRQQQQLPQDAATPAIVHPHENSQRCDSDPRAALRLVKHIVNSIRITAAGPQLSLNSYVSQVDLDEARNAVVLRVDVVKLLSPRHGNVPNSCLERAIGLIQRWFGTTVPVVIRPVLSAQRPHHEFAESFFALDHQVVLPEETTLHYFGPVFRGLVDAATTFTEDAALLREQQSRTEIICGLVVPEAAVAPHTLAAGTDAHPFEPLFFDKRQCLLQWFNGDASLRCRPTGGVSKPPIMDESDIVAAYSGWLFHRQNEFVPNGELDASTASSLEALPPQCYQPFVVRIPNHLRSLERKSTRATCLGSVVTSLEHGLRPISLGLTSRLLDQAVAMSVLRLLLTPAH